MQYFSNWIVCATWNVRFALNRYVVVPLLDCCLLTHWFCLADATSAKLCRRTCQPWSGISPNAIKRSWLLFYCFRHFWQCQSSIVLPNFCFSHLLPKLTVELNFVELARRGSKLCESNRMWNVVETLRFQ